MVFINRQLGNAFLMNAVDSTKDQEHYFGGTRKTIRLKYQFGTLSSSFLAAFQGPFDNGSLTHTGIEDVRMDSSGTLFACFNSQIPLSGNVAKSIDNGKTWTHVDFSGSRYNGLFIDSQDRIYVVGRAKGLNLWTTRRSADHGQTWTTLETYPAIGLGISEAYCVVVSGSTIFVGGASGSSTDPSTFLIRSSSDDGVTWANVEMFSGSGTTGRATCYDLAFDSGSGFIYAAGCYGVPSACQAVIKRSTSGGTTGSWVSVDDFGGPSPTTTAQFPGYRAITIAPNGDVYAVGASSMNFGGSRIPHWIVKKSHISSSIFSFADVFSGSINNELTVARTTACDVFVEPNNPRNIWVAGRVETGGFALWGLTRSEDWGQTWNVIELSGKPLHRYINGGSPALSASCVIMDRNGKILVGGTITNNSFIVSSGVFIQYHPESFKTQFSLTGTSGYLERSRPLRRLFDINNSPIDTGSFILSNFGINPDTPDSKMNVVLRLELYLTGDVESVSLLSGNLANLGYSLYFRDNSGSWSHGVSGNFPSDATDITKMGTYRITDDNTILYEFNFTMSSSLNPSFTYNNKGPMVELNMNSGSFGIRNLEIEFDQPLSDGGVKYFKEIGNQHTENISSYLNYNVMRVIS